MERQPNEWKRLWFVMLLGSCVMAPWLRNSLGAADVFVGHRVVERRVSMDHVDHAPWDRLLKAHVDANGNVDYEALTVQSQRLMLQKYLFQLSMADTAKPASRDGQMAFWINAYNALTIHGILREYPTTSIRNHTAKVVGYNIWKNLKLYVAGKPYSLEDIEHKVLRKMGEPRIHFAIVCASKSCPRLLAEAYTGRRLSSQLSANTSDFFRRRQNFRYDPRQERFYLSTILKWFADDFGADRAAQLQRIAPWLPEAAQAAARSGRVSVSYLDYDWALNEK